MWVFSICAPSVLYFSLEDPALIVSISDNEEEPGEVETQDGMEATRALPEIRHIRLAIHADDKTSPLENPANYPGIVCEVILPPPEASPLSRPEFFQYI